MLGGCSGHLLREQAAEQIKSAYPIPLGLPLSVTVDLGPVWKGVPDYSREDCYSKLSPETQWAEEQGFVLIQDGPMKKATVSLTENGEKAALHTDGQVVKGQHRICSSASFNIAQVTTNLSVTGLAIDGIHAKAEFQYQLTPVNNGEKLFAYPSPLDASGQILFSKVYHLQLPIFYDDAQKGYFAHGEALFQKYDDGWRVKKIDMAAGS